MSRSTVLSLAILIATLVHSASAFPPHNKLQVWFPKYRSEWTMASTVCKIQLNDYWTQNRTRCWATCACAVDCLLNQATETMKSNMAAASVVLGLMPVTLVLLGPSVAETSLLSTRYPLLAVLLSFASPAINVLHLYHVPDSPQSLLRTTPSLTVRKCYTWRNKQPSWGQLALRVAEWALASGAFVNTVQISLYLDRRTVSGWRCNLGYMPLSWALAGGLAHLLAMAAIRNRKVTSLAPGSSKSPSRTSMFSAIERGLYLAIVEHDDWKRADYSQDQILSEILFFLATVMSILHMVFGVLVFSSVIFIVALESVPVVARYASSAIVCQGILLFELGSMRLDFQEELSSRNHTTAPPK